MATESSQTLSRGLKLLSVIAAGREGVPVRELAAETGLPRSVVQRLLYTLEAEGFLERHPSNVGYRLTIKLWLLGSAAMAELSLRDVARPYLEDLARRTNEMTKIGVLDGAEVVYVDKVDCPRAVRAYVPIGGRAPAHSVATGKAILAYLPAEQLMRLDGAAQRHTSRNSGKLQFAEEMERIRRRGYAVNRGEWEDDVGAIAAPLFDAHGEPIASIGVILPLHRLTQAKIPGMGAWIRAAAAEISRKLGHTVTAEPAKLKRAG